MVFLFVQGLGYNSAVSMMRGAGASTDTSVFVLEGVFDFFFWFRVYGGYCML